ncbi:MAG: UV DNA damage repair endonuclease UvsE [Thermofilaceae archaeon]
MSIGLGIFCSTSNNSLNTNRKMRLSKLSRETLLKTFKENLRDFIELLKLSCSMGLTIFRLGSNFIPFASHERFDESWLLEVESRLRLAAREVKRYGVRITMHPGQYVVLNSPRAKVVERSLRELAYHFWVLDTLNLPRESIVVVHLGGLYGDKWEALRRFERTVEENEWLARRLAIENDERYYTAADAVMAGERLGLPVVFDYYHHKLNPSTFDMDRLVDTWRGAIPEFHSSSSPGSSRRFGEHADFVRLDDFLELVELWSDRGPLDVIVESKKKEKAVAKLIEELEHRGIKLRKPPCYPS